MRNSIRRLVVATLLLGSVTSAWACFPNVTAPGKTEVVTLDLIDRPPRSVVFQTHGFSLFIAPETILELVADEELSQFWPSGTRAALTARMPLAADVDFEDLIGSASTSVEPVANATFVPNRLDRTFLGRAVARLIEAGKVAISVDDAPMKSLVRERDLDRCQRPRLYRSADGRRVIEIVDWTLL